jgi:natural product biosynthesis luciferase-like monooxygenase protein
MKFGLMFFASSEDAMLGDKYNLVIESARFADKHEFSSIWTPERHFTKFGSLYPNPAVLNAALARETQQIKLLAGSVVLPINDPIRIAEEWAIVDNLSTGRIGISFASGWNPNDFVLFPENFQDRHQELFIGIEIIQKLWRSESIQRINGNGKQVEIRIYPTPVQPELPIWITAASNPQTFIKAGEIGANLLSHLFDQDIEELAEKISLYRQERAKNGHNPKTGIVSIVLHTFVGSDFNEVREQVRVPYCEYFKSNIGLLNGLAQSRNYNIDISSLSEKELDDFVNFVFEKFAFSRGLIGTPVTCLNLLEQLENIGVDEVSCLLDFGLNKNVILSHLPDLNKLRELYNHQVNNKINSIKRTNSVSLNSPPKKLITKGFSHRIEEKFTEIRRRFRDSRNVEEFYQKLDHHGLRLGENFRRIENLWLGKGEALAQIDLNLTGTNSHKLIKIHPVVLEACHQVLIASLPDEMLATNKPSLYLPVGVRSVQVYEPMTNQVWSHGFLSNSVNTANKSIEGDVRIFDPNGKLLAQVSGLQMQCVERLRHQIEIENHYADWFYKLEWQPKPLVKLQSSLLREPGNWMIFADQLGIGQSLATLLEMQGETCFVVYCHQEDRISSAGEMLLDPADPQAMQELIKQMRTLKYPCRGVVHLWSLNTTPSEQTTISSLDKDCTLTLTSTLHLVQSLIQTNTSQLPQLWLVTQGTQTTGSEAIPPAIAQAPIWGLGRSLASEVPHIWGGLVDIGCEFATIEAAKALFTEIWHQDGESQIALRSEQRYVARVVPSPKVDINSQLMSLHSDATYVITGGLGHLGLNAARWMVEKGAKYIVLVGRNNAADTTQQAIKELEDLGVKVLVVLADVSVREDVVRIFEKIQEYYPPVRGIFHAAGVAGFNPLPDMTPKLLQSLLAPKVAGTWNLHQITLGMKLDFFVCISSITSVWGSDGLCHYTAANHFLDIFAHYRHSLNLPALTVNVGALNDGGMHYRDDQSTSIRERVTQIGLRYYSPHDLLKTLEYSLGNGVAQQMIIDIDWAIFKEIYEARERRTLLKQIQVRSPKSLKPPLGRMEYLLHKLKDASPGDRYDLLLTYVQDKIALVLKLQNFQLPTPEQNLMEVGMDSLIAMELKNSIQTELGVDIPIVKFMEGITVATLTNELNKKLNSEDWELEIEFSQDDKVSKNNSSWIEGEI